jgi:hypothetical protein
MPDYYSTMTANECVPCTRHDFDALSFALQAEQQRIALDDDIPICIQIEYNEGEGVFMFAEDYFGDDDLTPNVCFAIGSFLNSVGCDYLEFSFSQTSSRIMVQSHGGGSFRIYSDGRLSWPKDVWPVI